MGTSQEEVTLYGVVGSHFVCKVQIALKLKGVEYKYVEDNLINKSDMFLKYNPIYKNVPVFVHNGKPICESSVIVEYIDETWKHNPILPSDPHQRALVRFWSKFIDEKQCLVPVMKSIFMVNEKEREKATNELYETLKFLEDELKNKFFRGDEFGLVDMAAIFLPIVQEIAGFQLFTIEKFFKLYQWSKDFHNHPIVNPLMPPKDQFFTYFKACSQNLKNTEYHSVRFTIVLYQLRSLFSYCS